MKLLDIHAHLNFPDYDQDRDAVIAKLTAAECGVINVGADLATSREVVELTNQPNFWATVGLHPHAALNEIDWKTFESLAAHNRVVAIGECGLDFFRLPTDEAERSSIIARQAEVFERQIEVAARLGKPLMLHIREAYDEVLAILKRHPGVRGNAHFFAGSLAQAKAFLELGFTLSFTGVVTFTNDYDEVIRATPVDQLLVETDSPYVAPVPHRGQRNEPLYVAEVAKRVAELKGVGVEELWTQVLATAGRVFGLHN